VIVIAGRIEIDPAQHEQAVSAAAAMSEASQREPGCRNYVISQELGRPGRFRIFEEWESQSALDAHFATAHLAEFERSLGALGVRSLGAELYEVASSRPLELPPHLQGGSSRDLAGESPRE